MSVITIARQFGAGGRTLGKMLADSQQSLASGKWWVMVFPGVAIVLIVLGFNLFGDGLRDALDPRLRGTD